MLRYLGELVSLLVFFLMVRSAVTGVWQLLRGAGPTGAATGTRRAAEDNPATMETSGELRRDPVCGTFVSMSTPYTLFTDGVTNYFCSAECRDQSKGKRSAERQWPKSSSVRS